MKAPIYLDHHATTPVDPAVVEAMLPYFTEFFGNPSSTETLSGRVAAEAVSRARAHVGQLLESEPGEIIFTSGATEASALAINGTALALREKRSRNKIVTTAIEHKAILEQCRALSIQGYSIAHLPLLPSGRVNLDRAREVIDGQTLLVTVQTANNEIGTIQPIRELAAISHEVGALIHTDAAQAVGKIQTSVRTMDVDLLSVSAHKFYGPKGIGALYIRNGPLSFPIRPLVAGGGQENHLRPGTINVPGVVGLGEAARLAIERYMDDAQLVASIRDRFETVLMKGNFPVSINGDLENRLPGNSSISFKGLDGHALIAQAPELELSTGSACTSGAIEPSHVLLAIGHSRAEAYSSLRLGFGRSNTFEDAELAANLLSNAALRLAAL